MALLAAAWIRFYKLTALSVWPMWDDSQYSFFAMDLAKKWHWQVLFGPEQYVPVYTWIQGLYYELVEPSLYSTWAFPALVSIPIFPAAYYAIRPYVSPSFVFLYLWLLAFTFWPFYVTRFSTDISLCLFWEYAAFWVFRRLARSLQGSFERQWPWAVGLGLMVGMGWYISKFWMANIPIFFLLVIYFLKGEKKWNTKNFYLFAGSFLTAFSPLLWLVLTGQYGSHIQSYSISFHSLVSSPWKQVVTSFSYISALFWGPLDQDYFNFGPLWGGLLNPILGSVFLLGLVEMVHQKKGRFLIVCGLLYLLPGMFSTSLEMMRIAPVLPALLWVTTLGFQKLFLNRRHLIFLAGLLVVSFSLDLYHLCGPYHQWAIPHSGTSGSKSPEHFEAFQIIEKWHQEKGPGLVLSDFYIDVFDQSLRVATYPFNAADNPRWAPDQAQWAAILLAPWDGEVLKQRFPSAVFYDLAKGLPKGGPGGLRIALVPLTGEKERTILNWMECHRQLQGLYPDYPYHVSNASYDKILQKLWVIYNQAPEEPFLKNCLMEKMIDAAYQSSDMSLAEPLLKLPVQALWHPAYFGRAYAVVFSRLGAFLAGRGQFLESEAAFKRAAYFDPGIPLKNILASLRAKSRDKGL